MRARLAPRKNLTRFGAVMIPKNAPTALFYRQLTREVNCRNKLCNPYGSLVQLMIHSLLSQKL